MRFALHTIFREAVLSYFYKWHGRPAREDRAQVRVPQSPASRPLPVLLIGDRCCRAVELRDVDSERLVIRLGAILQDTERNLLAQKDRPIRRTAEMYAGVNPMPERHVIRQLVQLAIDVQT